MGHHLKCEHQCSRDSSHRLAALRRQRADLSVMSHSRETTPGEGTIRNTAAGPQPSHGTRYCWPHRTCGTARGTAAIPPEPACPISRIREPGNRKPGERAREQEVREQRGLEQGGVSQSFPNSGVRTGARPGDEADRRGPVPRLLRVSVALVRQGPGNGRARTYATRTASVAKQRTCVVPPYEVGSHYGLGNRCGVGHLYALSGRGRAAEARAGHRTAGAAGGGHPQGHAPRLTAHTPIPHRSPAVPARPG